MTDNKFILAFSRLSLPTKLLAIIEPLSYGLSIVLWMIHAQALYFVGIGAMALLGVCLAKKSFAEPSAQALQHIYTFDVLFLIAGGAAYVLVTDDVLREFCRQVYNAAAVSLTLMKLITVLMTTYSPEQEGLPSLIPFVKSRRLVPADKKFDRAVKIIFAICWLYGGWLVYKQTPIAIEIWIVPFLLTLYAEHAKAKSAKNKELTADAHKFAVQFQACSPEIQAVLRRAMLASEEQHRKIS